MAGDPPKCLLKELENNKTSTTFNEPDAIVHQIQSIQSLASSIQLVAAAMISSDLPQLATVLLKIQASASCIQSLAITTFVSDMVGKFLYFSKLPTEISFKVWKEALPGPRVVELYYPERRESGRFDGTTKANVPPPIVLHVCQESRQVALKKYMELGRGGHWKRITAIDPTKDIIYFPYFVVQEALRPLFHCYGWSAQVCKTIKYMALDFRLRKQFRFGFFVNKPDFPALEELIYIIHEEEEGTKDWHECRRQKAIGIEFTEAADSRMVADTLETVHEDLEHAKKIWFKSDLPFDIKIMAMTRGGMKCCDKVMT